MMILLCQSSLFGFVMLGGGHPGRCGRSFRVGEGLGADLVTVAVGSGGGGGLGASVHHHDFAGLIRVGGAALASGERCVQLGLGANPLITLQGSHVGRVFDSESVRWRFVDLFKDNKKNNKYSSFDFRQQLDLVLHGVEQIQIVTDLSSGNGGLVV